MAAGDPDSRLTGSRWGPPRPKPRSSLADRLSESEPVERPATPDAAAIPARQQPDLEPNRPQGPAEIHDETLGEAVVGWLVIVTGPGRGADFRLRSGMNTIGRGGAALINIEYGDRGIDTGTHCRITFDPRDGRFYLSPGEGRGLVYSGDKPVLVPEVLSPMQEVELGSTILRFVPFCSSAFNWATS